MPTLMLSDRTLENADAGTWPVVFRTPQDHVGRSATLWPP